jgi:hypothetical protein
VKNALYRDHLIVRNTVRRAIKASARVALLFIGIGCLVIFFGRAIPIKHRAVFQCKKCRVRYEKIKIAGITVRTFYESNSFSLLYDKVAPGHLHSFHPTSAMGHDFLGHAVSSAAFGRPKVFLLTADEEAEFFTNCLTISEMIGAVDALEDDGFALEFANRLEKGADPCNFLKSGLHGKKSAPHSGNP